MGFVRIYMGKRFYVGFLYIWFFVGLFDIFGWGLIIGYVM